MGLLFVERQIEGREQGGLGFGRAADEVQGVAGGDADGGFLVIERLEQGRGGRGGGGAEGEAALDRPIALDRIGGRHRGDEGGEVGRIVRRGEEGKIEDRLETELRAADVFADGAGAGELLEHRLGDEAGVEGFRDGLLQAFAQGGEAFGMGGIGGEVLDLPRVGLGVEEFLGGLRRFPEGLVDAGELAVFPCLLHRGP